MADKTDKKLVSGVRKGNPESFDVLYELYKLPIFNFLYQMVGDVEEAKDLTQESFVAVYQVLLEKRKVENFKAYVYAVARNNALQRLQQRSKEHVDDELLKQVPDDSYYSDPARVARNRKQQADIMKALGMMPERFREVLILREQAGFSYERIAGILDTNKTNVGVMIYRARAKFREIYRMLQVTDRPESEECERILPLISSWLDGETTGKQERELQAHINECPFCRLASEQMVDANSTFHTLIPLLVPLTVKASVMAKVGLAGVVPTSIAASAAGVGGATSLAGASSTSMLGGAVAGSGSSASGVGIGATVGTVTAATGLSAKAVGVAAAVVIAATAAGGGAYVGIREVLSKPAATVQSVQNDIDEFVRGTRSTVVIPEALRKRADSVVRAARDFLRDTMPDYSYQDIVKAADTGSLTTINVSGLKTDVSPVAQSEAPVDCYLQITKEQGAYEVEKMTRELQP